MLDVIAHIIIVLMARVARRPRVWYGDFVGMIDEMRCTSSQDVCFPQALDH